MLFCNWGWAQQEALGGQKGIENTIFSVYDTNSTKSNEKTCSEYFCPGAFDPRWYGKEAETIHYIFSPSGSLLFTMRRDMLAGIILANFLPPKATTLYPSPPPLPSPINPLNSPHTSPPPPTTPPTSSPPAHPHPSTAPPRPHSTDYPPRDTPTTSSPPAHTPKHYTSASTRPSTDPNKSPPSPTQHSHAPRASRTKSWAGAAGTSGGW